MAWFTHFFRPPHGVEPAGRDPEPLAEALQVGVSDFVDCALRGGVLDGGEGGLMGLKLYTTSEQFVVVSNQRLCESYLSIKQARQFDFVAVAQDSRLCPEIVYNL